MLDARGLPRSRIIVSLACNVWIWCSAVCRWPQVNGVTTIFKKSNGSNKKCNSENYSIRCQCRKIVNVKNESRIIYCQNTTLRSLFRDLDCAIQLALTIETIGQYFAMIAIGLFTGTMIHCRQCVEASMNWKGWFSRTGAQCNATVACWDVDSPLAIMK